ncbi:MAG TPA: hypothetical protein EYQ18_10055 [Candidatus Handelsmanbacteria bacterium]|nr:hypothetical protein [Candidatus Handelsmanbacteria bacterium]
MSIRAFVFDLYGTLIEDLGRDGYDALLRQMAAVLLLSADGFSAGWRRWETDGRRVVLPRWKNV